MIPKIIHYTWFSGEDFPEDVRACMDTWKKMLPDYEFMLWDAKKLSEINNTFANEAVSVRKWVSHPTLSECMPYITMEVSTSIQT